VTVDPRYAALTFGLDRIPELQVRVLQIPLWQYIATAIYIVLAWLFARFLDYLVTVQLTKLAGDDKSKIMTWFIDLLHSPVRILSFVLLLSFGLNLFRWPSWLEAWIRAGFKVVLAFSLTYLALKMVDVLAAFWRAKLGQKADRTFNELLVPLVSKTLKFFLLIMAVLATLDNLGFNIRTLLAGVSISGLAIGLAAQDTVGNLFGAAAVFMDKPFKIGDRIKMGDVEGFVEEMGLRSTRIRNLDGHLITVPNKTVGNSTITNITRRPNIKTVLNIGVTYDTPAGKVRQALEILGEVYRKHPETHDVIIGFNQFADSSLNINVIHWWKTVDFKLYMAGMQEMNLEIKRRFDEAGISFAFPTRTVYLRQDNEWRIQSQPNNLQGGEDAAERRA
jgi:MscS family membrane protein